MRPSLPIAALLSTLLAACASAPPTTPPVSQKGTLKVHPGLLGQPVPPELQSPDAASVATVRTAGTEAGGTAPMKLDEAGLRTQRSVYFDLNSADLKADFNPMLQAHARYLAGNPNARVRLEGNADERGSADYNKRLGLKRAEAVRQSLLEQGAPEKQIKVTTLGEARPKLKGHDEESWTENRRTDVVYEKED